jgi:hypothetical protein
MELVIVVYALILIAIAVAGWMFMARLLGGILKLHAIHAELVRANEERRNQTKLLAMIAKLPLPEDEIQRVIDVSRDPMPAKPVGIFNL